jgi:hypothetical protein
MSSTTETGNVTGTKDKDYNLIWFTEQCLSNALRLETYIQDAERDGDNELAELFRKAQSDSRKGAERGKALLGTRMRGYHRGGVGLRPLSPRPSRVSGRRPRRCPAQPPRMCAITASSSSDGEMSTYSQSVRTTGAWPGSQ